MSALFRRRPDRRRPLHGPEEEESLGERPLLESSLLQSKGGAYQVEYTVVLVLVAVVASLAIGALAVPLIRYHLSITEAVTAPVP